MLPASKFGEISVDCGSRLPSVPFAFRELLFIILTGVLEPIDVLVPQPVFAVLGRRSPLELPAGEERTMAVNHPKEEEWD
jgi:hypothetical protein